MSKLLLILTLCTAILGCDFLEPKSAKEPVARVNDTYLYQEDIQALISENTTKQDSIRLLPTISKGGQHNSCSSIKQILTCPSSK